MRIDMEEQQQMELEALQAIFEDEIRGTRAAGSIQEEEWVQPFLFLLKRSGGVGRSGE